MWKLKNKTHINHEAKLESCKTSSSVCIYIFECFKQADYSNSGFPHLCFLQVLPFSFHVSEQNT